MKLNRTSRRLSPSLFCLAVALFSAPACAVEEVVGEAEPQFVRVGPGLLQGQGQTVEFAGDGGGDFGVVG